MKHTELKSTDTLARINRGISVPTHLTAPDGRRFPVLRWSSDVGFSNGERVVITASMIVEIQEPDDE